MAPRVDPVSSDRVLPPKAAAFAAFRALGARRIGVLTSYPAAVKRTVRTSLDAHGMEVAALATFDKPDDREAARIDTRSVRHGIEALCRAAVLDALFVSCTSLRLAGVAAEIESATGAAVTSSDHALAWHAIRLAGIGETIGGPGRLFRLSETGACSPPAHD